MADGFVCGLVLAAGGSRRLGQPKQVLPFGDRTLLDATLQIARASGFDQLVVAIGGAAEEIRERVDLGGAELVVNDAYGSGCSSSIAAALGAVDPRAGALVLLLGDMPGVTTAAIAALVAARAEAAAELAVCRYADGRGHPFAFGRAAFGRLATLHGDKAVWKLLDAAGDAVVEVPVAGRIPLDVDTWEDYEALLAQHGLHAPVATPVGRAGAR